MRKSCSTSWIAALLSDLLQAFYTSIFSPHFPHNLQIFFLSVPVDYHSSPFSTLLYHNLAFLSLTPPYRPVILFLPWLDQISGGVKKEQFALENVGGKGGMKNPIFLKPVQFSLLISNWFNSLCPLYVCFRRLVQQCVAQCHALGGKYGFPCVFSLEQLSCV